MSPPTPSPSAADRNLLFGILALQMNFVSRDQLIAGMQSWVFDKAKPLGQVLVDQRALQPERHALLEALVQEHLKLHGNDAEKSLAAVSSVGSVREELQQLADPDLQASLVHVSAGRRMDEDPYSTKAPSVGAATSTGLRFRILRPHAKGGLGQVSVALDEELHREVALKEIQDRHADHPDSRSRFVLEAEITGGLEHPGIVPVYGLGTYADGRPFYAMRFIRGDSLKDAIEHFHRGEGSGRNPGERTLELRKLLGRFIDVCNAIAYAHSRGVLHRDLKPGNVMLGKYGETLVVDWGLAKAVGQAEDHAATGERPLDPSSAGEATPTQAGAALGTPQYMSPEQAAGRLDELGPASDVYSLGATLYSLLTGKAPVEGPDLGAVLRRVQQGDFPPPRRVRGDVPAALEAVCLKAMARNPADRYKSPRVLADELEHWLADEPVSAWPEPWTFRARRWLSRHRTLTTAVMACILLATVGLSVGAWMLAAANERERSARNREQRARAVAEQKEQEATEQRAEAEGQRDETRAHLYAAHMRLAQYAHESGFLDRGRELLEAFRPGPGDKDLRGFEWYYLSRLCRNDQATLQGHEGPIYCLTFSPDGRSLLSGDGTGTVKIWPLEGAGQVASIQAHASVVWAVAFEPAGKTFATASADQTVKIWDAATHEMRRTLSGHTGVVYTLAYRPDGKMLASGSADKMVRLWDLATGEAGLTLRGHTGWVTTLAFSPDGQTLATGSDDGTIKLWDVPTGRATATLTGHTEDLVYVTFSPDGKTLASASTDQTVKLWDVKTAQVKTTLRGHSDYVACVVYAPGGALLATSSADGTAKLWDAATYQLRATLQGHTGVLYGLAFAPNGKTLATAAAGDKTIKFWDAATGRPRPRASASLEDRTCTALEGHTGVVYGVAVAADGKLVATASRDGTARVWDAATGQLRAVLQGHGGPVYGVALAPDGRTAATASEDKTAKLWDVATWQVKATLQGHEGPVYGVAFAPDGRTLATASEDGTARLWDAGSGQQVVAIRGHTGAVRAVTFAPDGTTLATGSADKTVRLWSVRTRQTLAILHGHTDLVAGLAYSPDGRVLASGSWDLTVRLWDTATGRLRGTLQGHNDGVTGVAFSPDGRSLASASWDRSAKLWNALTGEEMITLKGHTRWVSCVAFSRDGLLLAAGSGDKTANLWHAPGLHMESVQQAAMASTLVNAPATANVAVTEEIPLARPAP